MSNVYEGVPHNMYEVDAERISRRLEEVGEEIKTAERTDVEFPSYVAEDLNSANSQCEEACKMLKENREEALRENRKEVLKKENEDKLVYLLDEANLKVLKLRLVVPFYVVCAARIFFKKHEALASQYIPNYSKHNEEFNEISAIVKEYESPSKTLAKDQAYFLLDHQTDCCREQLNRFLKDIEAVKEALSDAIARKEEEKKVAEKRFCVSIGVAVAGIIIFGVTEIVKGCSNSSQQTAQPEAVVSEAENSTPNS